LPAELILIIDNAERAWKAQPRQTWRMKGIVELNSFYIHGVELVCDVRCIAVRACQSGRGGLNPGGVVKQ
jgi:hypothetical protein